MKRKVITIVLVAFLIFSGCGKKEEKKSPDVSLPKASETQDVKPQSGGQLDIAMRTTQTLNPILNEDSSVDTVLKLVFEPLVKIDKSFKIVPNIAESWSFSEDGRVMTMNIKKGIKWHDGKELDANDVVFSLNAIKNAGENTVYKKCGANISGYSKTGNYSISVTFNNGFSGNIYYMAFPIICSHDYSKGNAMAKENSLNPMGNGPFEFVSFTPAKELMLKKSVNSFDKEPYIDTVHVILTQDKDTDLYSFDQGIIDCVAADETELGKYDNSKKMKKYEYTTNYYDFIGFNFNRTTLQDINVRKAIAYSVPKKSIIESVYLNHAVAAETPINPKSWLYEKETQKYEYDLSKSKEFLNQSNWKDTNGDKIRDKTINEISENLKLTILINSENEERRQIAGRLADELRAIGFDITIDAVPFDTYVQRLNDKNFDIFIGGWELSVVPDLGFMLHSGGESNFISYNSAEMDTLLSGAYNAVGDDAIKAAYSTLQKYISENIPYVSLVFRNSAVFTDKHVFGTVNPLENNIFDTVEEWFMYDNTQDKK